ncbi:acyltransferase [Paenibacillus sp. 32352]|uniref:acyltransferase family protein n=1 Tax=Paenibacillus sp. 32352 TaxID=1969111 RepID=UPI0015C48E59|nr:acyltransferase [Paenibacillus sp. 32352]
MNKDIQNTRIDALTGLRGIAAFVVFLFHWGYYTKTNYFAWGFVGVSLFFCLSGFVLMVNYEKKFSSLTLKTYLQFMHARIARVWPMHLLGFFLSIPLLLSMNRILTMESAILNVTLLHSFIQRTTNDFNADSWSLSNEFFFYLMFPFLCFLLIKYLRSNFALITVFMIISLFLLSTVPLFALYGKDYLNFLSPGLDETRIKWFLYFFPITRITEFILGMISAKMWMSTSRQESKRYNLVILVILLISAGLWLLIRLSPLRGENFTLLFGPFFALLLMIIAKLPEGSSINTFLSSKWMIRFGEWSFAFYIIHELLIKAIILLKLDKNITGLIAFTLALGGSALFFAYVETPMRKLILYPTKTQKSIEQAT